VAIYTSVTVDSVPVVQTQSDESPSLSDKIALGVGIGFGIPTVIIGGITIFLMYRSWRARKLARQSVTAHNLANIRPLSSIGGSPPTENSSSYW
jgi:hypothetical protein